MIKDDGCSYWAECLSCPLPKCRYEMSPKQALAYARLTRTAQMMNEGKKARQIADELQVTVRSVRRTIAQIRHSSHSTEHSHNGYVGYVDHRTIECENRRSRTIA